MSRNVEFHARNARKASGGRDPPGSAGKLYSAPQTYYLDLRGRYPRLETEGKEGKGEVKEEGRKERRRELMGNGERGGTE